MISTEELFSTIDHWGRLHDVIAELEPGPYREYSIEEVRAAWDRLPEDIQNIAHCWGMETVFGDEAYEWLRDNPVWRT